MFPGRVSTAFTDITSPRSVVLRNRPRTTYTFGPRYGVNSSEPASVSVTATYAVGDSAALRRET